MQSLDNKVINRIYGHGRGWTFTQVDFSDLGPRETVDWVLHTLEKRGTIRRVMRGVYDYPRTSSLLKETLPPDIEGVAHALARKFGWRIAPSGETALNILGLSTQVPAQYVYMTNSRSRTYGVGNRSLVFKKSMLKEVGFSLPESTLIVQAIRALGKGPLTAQQVARIRQALGHTSCRRVLRDTRRATGWIREQIRRVCGRNEEQ